MALSARVILVVLSILLNSSLVFAQQAAAQQGPGLLGQLVAMAPMFLMIMAIFYFLVVLPQKKELKRHQEFINSLKKGVEVVTSGGIIAKVASVEKDHILLDLGTNTKIKCEIAHVKRSTKLEQAA